MQNCKKTRRLSLAFIIGIILVLSISILGSNKASAASSPYLIKVNKKQNVITFYEKDKKGNYTVPVKAMICSTGPATPLGTFQINSKYKWKLMIEDVWSQYATRIKGDILFHSVWYYEPDASTLSARQYNKLGLSASHGCIRLTVMDAKWLQDNCPSGTTVIIYNSNNPGPLGKPKALILKANTGWDPTDVTNPKNPFNKKKPSITGAKSKSITYNTKVDLKKGITAYSTAGTEITGDLKISGKVNITKPGKYKIKYTIKDAMGRKAKKTITYTVKEDVRKPVFAGIKNKTVKAGTVVDKALALTGVSAKVGGVKLDKSLIQVTISVASDTETYTKYSVKYSVTAPTSKKTTTKTITITVDKTAPLLTGVADKYLTQAQLNECLSDLAKLRTYALEGISCADNITVLTADKIQVSIKANNQGTYYITYTVSDNAGNVTTQVSNVIVLTNPKLEVISSTPTITAGQVVTNDIALNNVRFTANGQDFTAQFRSKIQVEIKQSGSIFSVNYTLTLGSETFPATATFSP